METELRGQEGNSLRSRLRAIVATLFRQKRLVVACLIAAVAVSLACAFFLPSYKTTMRILVERGRQDPMVSPIAGATNPMAFPPAVTEEEINSEVNLLTSEDVARQVAVACGLQNGSFWQGWFKNLSDEEKISLATKKVARALDVTPIPRSNVITVSYASKDPQLAHDVVKHVRDLYLAKHSAVHRPSGQSDFFDKQVKDYEADLQRAEAQLSSFSDQYGAVTPQLERDLVLQKANEFSGALQQARAGIAETQKRIADLQRQTKDTPERLTTMMRRSDNPQLLEQLKGTLLTLELKRVELLTKFRPDYRPVQEVEKQIKETRAALANEESAPVREETTDQNPTQQLLRSEMAKARAEVAGLQARAKATEKIVALYQAKAKDLDRKSIIKQDLMRDAKAKEENYLLYLKKREEARASDALDKRGIVNVAVADEPNVPALTSHNPLLYAIAGWMAALLIGGVLIYGVDRMDESYRTPDEVEDRLGIPVLAAVPAGAEATKGTVNRSAVERDAA